MLILVSSSSSIVAFILVILALTEDFPVGFLLADTLPEVGKNLFILHGF